MAFRLIPLALLGLTHIAAGFPAAAHTLLDLEVADDMHSVGSYVREVRAAPPDYHRSYENEGDGELGFSRKKSGGGKKGYQHFDSYHKKAGDNYEFEKQDSFGHDDGGKGDSHGHHHEDHDGEYSERRQKKEKYREQPSQRHRDDRSEQYRDNRDKPSKDEVELIEGEEDGAEHDSQGLKKNSDDGNGGVEAYGHDKADYALPEKYTYGEGDEYNF